MATEQSATSTASAGTSERDDSSEDARTVGAAKRVRVRDDKSKAKPTAGRKSKAKSTAEPKAKAKNTAKPKAKRTRTDSVRPRRRFGLLARLAAVTVALAVGAAGIWLFTRATAPKPGLSAADIPALQVQAVNVRPGSAVPKDATVAANIQPRTQPPVQQPHAQGSNAQGGPAGHGDPLTGWASKASAATGIPEPALWAYGDAELVMRAVQPGCHLSWTTLAGIGRVESNHGQFGGAQLQSNGEESKPIIGVPLDGSGDNRAVGDTDHGALDGDPKYDHAVGPMQFLPSTWRSYAADGNGDGKADPENIDDAALTTARYLCVGGRDMGTPQGWWAGLFSYNNSVEYGQKVFGLAETYGRQAQQATGR